ncbi:MAG TPA: hypothetical protein VGO62_18855 [Myxococcota bacterium]
MIPGFNHNIKHKGRIYHIQTEDSGPKNPHIITHLFVGGNILASKKTEYTEILGKPDYEKTVRSMMEEQHKQMLRNLVNGVYDSVATGPAYHLDGPAPANFTANSPATSAMAGAAAFKGLPSQAAHPGAQVEVDASWAAVAASGAPGRPAPLEIPLPAGGIAVSITPPSTVPTHTGGSASAIPEPARASNTGTIFGEDLISEKSLDEVILGYLAEDLDSE